MTDHIIWVRHAKIINTDPSGYGLVRHSRLESDRELLMGDLAQNSGKRIVLQCNNYLIYVTVIVCLP